MNETGASPAPRGWLAALRQALARVRARINSTGLFPDLTGEAGRNLRRSVRADGDLTKSFMLMSALSAGIAALGLLQSSTAVVIGAMLISPLMGPIASMGFGFASLDGHQIRDSVKVIAVGALIGIVAGMLLTWLSPIRNATPEIIARTEPTLLDLGIAILSGMAGAYATVQQKGATAIGVAIATALMPPLATVGYGLGVANAAFTLGAFLLFLTNLGAIAFSFALVARLSGAARPIANVELTPRYVFAGLVAFGLLATPLALTLYRITREASALGTVRRVLVDDLNLRPTNIAQLEVKWPLRGEPSVDALVVVPRYAANAEARMLAQLERAWGRKPALSLQQVVAADIQSQTRAIVDAAVERSTAGIARDVPPLKPIRAAVSLPTEGLWVNRSDRTVQVVPFAADGWTLGDYRVAEKRAITVGEGWRVRVVPPVLPLLLVPVGSDVGVAQRSPALDDAIWAIERWGVQGLTVSGIANGNMSDEDRAIALSLAHLVVAELAASGITATPAVAPINSMIAFPDSGQGVEMLVIRAPDSESGAP